MGDHPDVRPRLSYSLEINPMSLSKQDAMSERIANLSSEVSTLRANVNTHSKEIARLKGQIWNLTWFITIAILGICGGFLYKTITG